mgnify:CR=1 FL=1
MAVDINWNPKHNWRLRFHLQTPTGGLTDPNGLSQLNGVYQKKGATPCSNLC